MEYQDSYQQTDGAFGWDDEIREENSFTLLPEGIYRFQIKSFEKARFNGSDKLPACPKAVVSFVISAPDGTSAELKENYLLHKKMEWKLSEFFAAVGLKARNEPVRMMWTPELIGKQGVCRIIIHNYQKDGENRQINRIDKLYPSYDQPAVSSPAPAQNTGGWQKGKF